MIISIPNWSPIFRALDFFEFIISLRFSTKPIGQAGEDFALTWLRKNYFFIVEKNWEIADGELDLVAIYSDRLHFIEVKTRHASLPASFGAHDAIDRSKSLKLKLLSENYQYRRINLLKRYKIKSCQIDLIALTYRRWGPIISYQCDYCPDIVK